MSEPTTVSINFFNEEFIITCNPDEQASLQEAIDTFEQQMRDIRVSGKHRDPKRIALMIALNTIAENMNLKHEVKSQNTQLQHVSDRTKNINNQIESELFQQESLIES